MQSNAEPRQIPPDASGCLPLASLIQDVYQMLQMLPTCFQIPPRRLADADPMVLDTKGPKETVVWGFTLVSFSHRGPIHLRSSVAPSCKSRQHCCRGGCSSEAKRLSGCRTHAGMAPHGHMVPLRHPMWCPRRHGTTWVPLRHPM